MALELALKSCGTVVRIWPYLSESGEWTCSSSLEFVVVGHGSWGSEEPDSVFLAGTVDGLGQLSIGGHGRFQDVGTLSMVVDALAALVGQFDC